MRNSKTWGIVAAGGLALLTASPTAHAQSDLRARIEAARAAARARAEAMARREQAAQAKARANANPQDDPELWRIDKFHVPSQSMGLGLFSMKVGEQEPRFYAKTTRQFLQAEPDFDVGTKVFFYLHDEGRLTLAGRGEVVKIRRKGRPPVIEASVDACRYMRTRTRRQLGVSSQSQAILKTKSPSRIPWYMSTKLKGHDTEGWQPEQYRRFALGQPWLGMSENALLAMLGTPDERVDVGGALSLVYGEGAEAIRYDLQGGQVTNRVEVGAEF